MIQIQIFNIILNSIVQLILFSIIPFIWWLLTARKKEDFFKWIGLKKPFVKGCMSKIIILILIVFVGYMILMSIIMYKLMGNVTLATNQFYKQGLSALPSILFFAIIQTGLSEELFFRGFLGKRLIHQFGFAIGNTIQAILFGILHGLPLGLATNSVLVAVLVTLLPAGVGWFEGWINEKYSDGSIIPSWIIHSIMNIFSGLSTAFGL